MGIIKQPRNMVFNVFGELLVPISTYFTPIEHLSHLFTFLFNREVTVVLLHFQQIAPQRPEPLLLRLVFLPFTFTQSFSFLLWFGSLVRSTGKGWFGWRQTFFALFDRRYFLFARRSVSLSVVVGISHKYPETTTVL